MSLPSTPTLIALRGPLSPLAILTILGLQFLQLQKGDNRSPQKAAAREGWDEVTEVCMGPGRAQAPLVGGWGDRINRASGGFLAG